MSLFKWEQLSLGHLVLNLEIYWITQDLKF